MLIKIIISVVILAIFGCGCVAGFFEGHEACKPQKENKGKKSHED